ncbi:MAG: polysaccharide deacetylase family protein [Bacillota bacterium]|nr:polysaccharide deacetylase family protein [Bacillota bacterium]
MKRKYVKVGIIVAVVLFIVGIGAVYTYVKYNSRKNYKSNVTNAEEVIAPLTGVNDNRIPNRGTDSLIVPRPQKVTMRPDTLSRDRFAGKKLVGNNSSVPVLMYHCIDKEVNPKTGKLNELKVPPEVFREQMAYLKDNGFTTITLEELYKFIVNNEQIPEKSIVITLDDGYVDNYTNGLPILKELGLTATVFIITDYVDKNGGYLTSGQLKEMYDSGIDIESHTLSHPRLNEKKYDVQVNELKASKEYLEKLLDKKAEFIAYPYGNYNSDTLKAAKEAGYKMGFLATGPWANKNNGVMLLRRIYISALKDMGSFKDRINNSNY